MPIFNAGTQVRHTAINKFMESRIKAPYVHSQVSTLGGVNRASIIIGISLDPKSKWANGQVSKRPSATGYRDAQHHHDTILCRSH